MRFYMAMGFSFLGCTFASALFAEEQPAKIGRPVKVSAIAIGIGGDREAKVKLAIEHLEKAGEAKVDVACLPEEFSGLNAEPIPGPTTDAIAELAKKHGMYVVCPIREQGADGRQYNASVLIDRKGQIAGYYRKVFVFWDENLHCGGEGVKTFDTDFGRVAILTCFDANFDEVWQEAERKGAELILWPSAYGGGMPLNGFAMIHNYPIVAVGRGNIIDMFGREVKDKTSPMPQQYIATLDLDTTIVHKDFTGSKINKLLGDYRDSVKLLGEYGDMEGWFVLKATRPGTSVRELCKKYELETLREYRHRSRQQINALRAAGERVNLNAKIPAAAKAE